ncbi:hypothetical protein [Streptomyces sp. NBC_00059]|uniref:hypothetical protein n=1 Tax=Streptomyces sp. NBC_00059 TaxID=2975635 RepID=UPI00225B1CD5|nr:hypothetical protein [Streptomyces sp. NBC_00059]MCX5414958.1 hypothetical protein [Streptomyces sp. NBC_00059]
MENAGTSDLCLFIEPYGEDFSLKPGEGFTLAAEVEGIEVWFCTIVREGGITVWPYEDGDPTKIVLEYTVTDARGTRLECGHQRPPKPAGSDAAELG